jgi:hypothetical protein
MITSKFNYNLLLIAFVISPFTLLRISFFGVAELIFIYLFINSLVELYKNRIKKVHWRKFYITKFWFYYLFISILGFSYSAIVLEYEIGTIKGMLFDFSAYLFILMTSFVLEREIIIKKLNTYLFLKRSFYLFMYILTFFYIISFFTPTFFGLSIKYHVYFAPLVLNIHQIAMIIIILPFIGMKIYSVETNKFLKLLLLLFIIIGTFLSLDTGTTKATLGLVAGYFVFILMWMLSGFRNFTKYLIIFFTSIFLFIYLISSDLYEVVIAAFKEADPHGARAYLYEYALDIGLSSFLIGHGTGPHIAYNGTFYDAHQTFLTIFLQTGVIGVILFFNLMRHIIHKNMSRITLIAALTPIFIYASGGDILRRLPIWIILIFILHYSTKDEFSCFKR